MYEFIYLILFLIAVIYACIIKQHEKYERTKMNELINSLIDGNNDDFIVMQIEELVADSLTPWKYKDPIIKLFTILSYEKVFKRVVGDSKRMKSIFAKYQRGFDINNYPSKTL